MQYLGKLFGYLMSLCYAPIQDYGLAIILFTFLSKVILIPLSVVVQKNSIKMVKMYPEINRIKAKYYGDADMISEEQYKLYKKENYHALFDLIPVIIQLVILIGVVDGIKNFTPDNNIFMGINLSLVPSELGGIYIAVPLVAAFSAWLMCFTQNKSNA